MVAAASSGAGVRAPPDLMTASTKPAAACEASDQGLVSQEIEAEGVRGGVASCQGSVADKLKFFATGKHREGSGLGEFRAYSARRKGRGGRGGRGTSPVGKLRLSDKGGSSSGQAEDEHARV